MKYWYFKFEGRIEPKGREGVFSGCLVPTGDFKKAEAKFHKALKENNIHLLDLMDCFEVDADDLDPDDPDHHFWIRWYMEVKEAKELLFDIWNLYPIRKKRSEPIKAKAKTATGPAKPPKRR